MKEHNELIKKYIESGLSVFPGVLNPPKDKSGLPVWGPIKKHLVTEEEFQEMYQYIESEYGKVDMIGLAMFNLWCIDLDEKDYPGLVDMFVGMLKEDYPELYAKLPMAKTKSNGLHIFFRARGANLLRRKFIKKNGEVIAEGLGQGQHFARIYPTPGYEMVKGSLLDIPMLAPEEVRNLVAIADRISDSKPPKKEPESPKTERTDDELKWFNTLEDNYLEECGGLEGFLEWNAGWIEVGRKKFVHEGVTHHVIEYHDPAGESTRSAIIDPDMKRVMVFSTSSKLRQANDRRSDVSGEDKDYWLDIFDVYATYKTGGNLSKAVKEMAKRVGMDYTLDLSTWIMAYLDKTGRGAFDDIEDETTEEVEPRKLWNKSLIIPEGDRERAVFMDGAEILNTARFYDPEREERVKIRMDYYISEPTLGYFMDEPIPVLFDGSIGYTTGRKKSGKTFNASSIVGSAVSDERVLGLRYYRHGGEVLWIDTEQEIYFFQATQRRVYEMAGLDLKKCAHYEAVHLRRFNYRQRLKAVQSLIMGNPNLSLVMIDGLVDLLANYNDLEQSQHLMNTVMRWCDAYNINLFTILHSNKGDGSIRGHLGSELQNKATFGSKTIRIKGDNCFMVASDSHRGAPFDPYAFKRTGNATYLLIEVPE